MNTLIDALIIAGPLKVQNASPRAILSLVIGDDTYWIAACKPGKADQFLVARMVALLSLHQTHPLLYPVLVPTGRRHASALFAEDGTWTDQRGVVYPQEVRTEVDRIAAVMRSDHAGYLAQFISALKGERASSLHKIPEHLPIKDQEGHYWLVPAPPRVEADERIVGSSGTPELFSRLVVLDYQNDRYLQHQSEAVLMQRATDAVVTIFDVEGERVLAVNLADLSALNAMARLGEVMEELRLRHGALPPHWLDTLTQEWKGPGGTPARTRKALDWIASHQSIQADGLVKFGKISHLRRSLSEGRFLLRPASSYSDVSLNRAQFASELTFHQEIDVRKVRFRAMDTAGEFTVANLQPTRAVVTRSAPTDAYVFCGSRRISARLFHDFEADACLLIRDRPSFMRRMAESTRSVLPGWRMIALDVRYIDPFSPEARDARPLFDKTSRYEYQKEHRVLWLPPQSRRDLEPVFVEIGSLADIAELIFIGEDSDQTG